MDGQEEEPLQAVILADAFSNVSRYGPLVRGGGKHEGSNESALPWVRRHNKQLASLYD